MCFAFILLALGFIKCLLHHKGMLEEVLNVLTSVSRSVSSLWHFYYVSVSSCLDQILNVLSRLMSRHLCLCVGKKCLDSITAEHVPKFGFLFSVRVNAVYRASRDLAVYLSYLCKGLMQSTGLAVIWLFISVICVKCYCVADELNILQIGAGDCRHIVKTLAHCYQHPSTKINVSLILLHFYRIDRACD